MSTASCLETQQSSPASQHMDTPSGSWRLGDREALALQPRVRSLLKVQAGGLWVTVTPRRGRRSRSAEPADRAGDLFLQPGETLIVAAGERAVLQPWHAGGAAFAWDRVAAAVPQRAAVSSREAWGALVAPSWAELAVRTQSAIAHAGAAGLALGRLSVGLWRFAVARRRGRAMPVGCRSVH